ncbi:hypothetical protein AX14_009131 [Amanita brunnescens Koide BX004]|nr:hypothetical protein AX14_009131 [Amanita brunnescens Koide BX004]
METKVLHAYAFLDGRRVLRTDNGAGPWEPLIELILSPLLTDSIDVHGPRALAAIFAKAEAYLAERKHPDPYIAPSAPGGTIW